MKEKLTIIYFGDYWDDRWRRRQQLAYHLSQKMEVEKVIYVELATSVPELFKSFFGIAVPGVKDRWRRILRSNMSITKGKIEIVTPFSFLSLYKYSTKWDHFFLKKITLYAIKKGVSGRSLNGKVILWLSHPFAAHYIGEFGEIKLCYDCTERFSEFKEWGEKVRKFLGKNDIYVSRKADFVFVQTVAHLEEKKKLNPNAFLIPNAVDISLYNKTNRNNGLHDIKKIKKPILGYIGRYNTIIDENLLAKVADHFKDCALVIVGELAPDGNHSILKDIPNVHFLGPKSLDTIPMYLEYFDVCLMPYKQYEFDRWGSPLKLFDYLASGKPIVSTGIAGVQGFENLIRIASSDEEFIRFVSLSLADNDNNMVKDRKESAMKNSWEIRTEQVWDILRSSLK